MAQISKYPISQAVYERILEIFFKALVGIQTQSEAEQFIKDFLTPTEKIMLAKRLAIAFLLEKNYGYRTISKVLRVSLPTVASVNLIRKYGGKGYQKNIEKLLKEEKVKDFLLRVSETLTEVVSHGGKGSGTWRYLHDELRSKRLKKSF